MARIRSPGYPGVSLEKAIDFAHKIHEQDRQNPISSEIAAQHLNFSGRSGSSDRAIAALMHFGLTEKSTKGEIRVSNLALRIIHADIPTERLAALRIAAFNPELFHELRIRYSGLPPSHSALASYLARLNFGASAVDLASKAYLDTCSYMQREGAYALDDLAADERPSMDSEVRSIEHLPIQSHAAIDQNQAIPPASSSTQQGPAQGLMLNQTSISVRGNTVHVEALLDFDGLLQLESQLAALKTLVRPMRSSETSPGS